MALKGNLKDFNLPNILQMISAEKKTGILSVLREGKYININFLSGQVVSVDRDSKIDELCIKNTLLKNKYMTEISWQKVYAERQNSLMPYFHILKNYVNPDVISALAFKQIKDGVFELLRWNDGDYEFIPQKSGFENFEISPLDVEFLLMEGCRVADEWSSLEKRLPGLDDSLVKNILDQEHTYIDTTEGQDNSKLELEILKKRGVELAEDEEKAFLAIDAKTTLNHILTCTMTGKFETCQAVVRFLSLNILKVDQRKKTRDEEREKAKKVSYYTLKDKLLRITFVIFFFALNLWGISKFYENIMVSVKVYAKNVGVLKKHISVVDQDIISKSIYEYRLLKGSYPEELEKLVEYGLLDKKFLYDPWLQKYQYYFNSSDNSFSIAVNGK